MKPVPTPRFMGNLDYHATKYRTHWADLPCMSNRSGRESWASRSEQIHFVQMTRDLNWTA